MFRFEHPEHLYALALLPVVALFFIAMLYARRRAIRRFGSTQLMQRLMPEMSRYKHTIKFGLLLFALFFLIIGWANPQWGSKKEKVQRRSVDVFLALDISRSMLATDIPPARLERAKRFAQELADALRGERIGLILFAGNAYLQVPLTTDYAAVNLFLRSANPDMAPTQGTAIGAAINLAERSFEPDNTSHKAMVLISDGENHEEEALEEARIARDNGLLLFTVGVGTAEGSFIPIQDRGRQDYKRDQSGNPVRSRLNEEMLRNIARTGDGVYFNLSSGSEQVIEALQERINNIEKQEFEQRSFSNYESYFQYFIAMAIALLLVEFFISYRRSRFFRDKDIFEV